MDGPQTNLDLASIADILINLPDEKLIAVLERVFSVKTPNPEEAEWNINKYFLGTASKLIETEGQPDHSTSLERWEIQAVGYIDRNFLATGDGPDWGFCEGNTCSNCNTSVRSNVKRAICPVCSTRIYLT